MNGIQAAFVRTAVVYLLATGLLGVAFLFEPPWTWAFRVVHVHAGILGFFLSLVMGMAVFAAEVWRRAATPEALRRARESA